MARIPEAVVDEVRQSVNITDVVSQYVQLKKAGKNLFGVCPFHEERTPSFSVSEDKQIFHCFSCGRGGNVFKFLMEIKNISFPEAVAEVAKLANVNLPQQYLTNDAPKVDPLTNQLIKVHEQVASLYHHILVNTAAGEPALKYLQERGLTRETIDAFQLGYAPRADIIRPFLQQHQVSDDLLVQSGLFNQRDNGELSDRFFDRVMFPIKNGRGQPIAFSGRVLNQEAAQAKYLNSPETKIFSKRDVVFNLDRARSEVVKTKDLILFEGFMDVISATQAGVKNGIASMGTSFTDQQIHQIERVSKRLLICYDGDAPGQKAINRAVDELSGSRLQLGVIQMPSGVDPDEYRRQKGDVALQQLVKSARETPVSFKLHFLRQGVDLSNDDNRVNYLRSAVAAIATLPEPLERDVYINKLVDEFNVDKDSLLAQIQADQQQHRNYRQPTVQRHRSIDPAAVAMLDHQPNEHPRSRVENAERFLMARMVHDRDVWLKVTSVDGFCFADTQYQTVYMFAEDYFSHHTDYDVADFASTLPDVNLQNLVVGLESLPISEQSFQGEVDDYVSIIMNDAPLEERIKRTNQQLKEAQRTGDRDLQLKYGNEMIGLMRQKQSVNKQV